MDALWTAIRSWLLHAFQAVLQWWLDLVLWVPRKIFSMFCDGVISYLQTVQVPPEVAELFQNFALMSASVWYVLHLINFSTGMQIILAAYLFRNTWRYVPFVGS